MYKKVNGLNRAYAQTAHELKRKADSMPSCAAKDFYLSLFDNYVKCGRWSDKQIKSVSKALGRDVHGDL